MGTLTRATCDARLDAWSRRLMRETAIDLHVHGRDKVPDDRETFVVMSNHQSLFDIPVLFRALHPMTLRMVAKTELYRIPVFGRTLTNSDGKEVFVRDVAEQHVLEDLGWVPSLSDWLREMPSQPKMSSMT